MARKEACERVLQNVQFERRDVSSLEQPESFDLVTAFDAIRDLVHALHDGSPRPGAPGMTFVPAMPICCTWSPQANSIELLQLHAGGVNRWIGQVGRVAV